MKKLSKRDSNGENPNYNPTRATNEGQKSDSYGVGGRGTDIDSNDRNQVDSNCEMPSDLVKSDSNGKNVSFRGNSIDSNRALDDRALTRQMPRTAKNFTCVWATLWRG